MKVVSLFSGIGGIDLGCDIHFIPEFVNLLHRLVNAGHEIILQVENNPHCIQVLKTNFPATAIVLDIVTLQSLPAETDIVVAGFPCQDLSTENYNRAGIEKGLRSSLVSHVFRLLRSKKAPWVIFENVPGLLNWHWNQTPPQQPGIAHIARELEQLGYRWAYRVVDLTSFGIPHSRARVFVVASIHGDPRDILLSQNIHCQGQCSNMFPGLCYTCSCQQPISDSDTVACVDLGEKRHPPYLNVLHCLTTANGRRTCIVRNMCNNNNDTKKVCTMLDVRDAERLFGFPEGWTESCYPIINPDKPAASKIDYKIQTQKRLSVLGNSCAVPIFFWIGQQLNEPYISKFLMASLGKPFVAECPGSRETSAWPRCAWNVSPQLFWKGRYGISGISSSPQLYPYIKLGKFLRYGDEIPNLTTCKKFLVRLKKQGFELLDFVVNGMLGRYKPAIQEHLGSSSDVSDSDEPQYPFIIPDDNSSRSNPTNTSDEFEGEKIMFVSYSLHGDMSPKVLWPVVSVRTKATTISNGNSVIDSYTPITSEHHLALMGSDRILFSSKETECQEFFASYGRARSQSICSSQKENYILSIDQALAKFRAQNLDYFDIFEREVTPSFKKAQPCGRCKVCIKVNKRVCDAKRKSLQTSELRRQTHLMKEEQQVTKELSRSLYDSCPLILSTRLAHQGHQGAAIALLQAGAIAKRVKILWSHDNEFFGGTITNFDPLSFTHSVVYDDADEDLELKMWREIIISM